MLPEYDLSDKRGVRGKYANAAKAGYSVVIKDKGKAVEERYYAAIEADVHAYFPDSNAINKVLRQLIGMIPTRTERSSKKSAR